MPKLMGLFKISTAMCVINLHKFYILKHLDWYHKTTPVVLDRDDHLDDSLTTSLKHPALPLYAYELVEMFEDRQGSSYPVECAIQ